MSPAKKTGRPPVAVIDRRRIHVVSLFLLLLTACSDAAGPGPQPPGPGPGPGEPTPIGSVTGAAVSAQIGPEGGELASSDGGLKLTVPAGALSAATTFSIQPIQVTAQGGVGTAYRLQPHDVAFAKRVRLTFRYTQESLRGTTPFMLRPAYQDSTRRWRMYRKPTVDVVRGEVSVETSHFSDWSLVAGAQLMPNATNVRVGQAVELAVKECRVDEPPSGGTLLDSLFVPIGYRCHDPVPHLFAVNDWSVNGTRGGSSTSGTVEPRTGGAYGTAVFRAPASVPSSNPIAVSVKYATLDPADDGLLVAHITVTEAPGACGHLRTVATWEGTFGVAYSFEGNRPGSPDHTRIEHFAEVHARLTKLSEGPGGATWEGTPTGLVRVSGRTTTYAGTQPRVTVVSASGQPLSQPMLHERSRVFLSVNFEDCTYTTGMSAATTGTVQVTDRPVEAIEASIGSVRTNPRATGGSSNLTAGGDFAAHSAIWAITNPGEAYIFGAFSGDVITAGFATEGNAGSARVSWSFQPTQN